MSDFIQKRVDEARARAARLIDGVERPAEAEEKINAAFRSVFGRPDGRMVMDYLRSITLNTVLPPSATDGELRMQEGMRRLFGIIDARRSSKPQQNE